MENKHEIKRLYQQIAQYLLHESPPNILSDSEAHQVSLWILEHYLQTTWNDILLHKTINLAPDVDEKIWKAAKRVVQEEPVQYIFGEAYFYGRRFIVSPAVLIPRRETEEMVHKIIQENSVSGLRILDIGTGSGCIAITLKKEISDVEVHAWDISQAAIEITRKNARLHEAEIQTAVGNIMEKSFTQHESSGFDIIVSNPPYVRVSEAAHMQNNVLRHEPYIALFVDDADPLLFYRQIVELCTKKKFLKKGGYLYLEINENLAVPTAALLEEKGIKNVQITQDMQKKDRFVKGTLPL